MRAARLNRRISFQAPIQTRELDGSLVEGWATQVTVWGALEQPSGREMFVNDKITTEVSHLIIVRFRRDIKSTWRAVVTDAAAAPADRYFRIVAVTNPFDGRRELHIPVKELPDGEPA